jgi:hypothetical protein
VATYQATLQDGIILGSQIAGNPYLLRVHPQNGYQYLTSDSPTLLQISINQVGTISADLPALTCYAAGGGQISLKLPALIISASGNPGTCGTLEVELPVLSIVAGGFNDITGGIKGRLSRLWLFAQGIAAGRFDDCVLRYTEGDIGVAKGTRLPPREWIPPHRDYFRLDEDGNIEPDP